MFKTKLCQRLLFDFALELALARLVKILHFSQPASLKLRSRRNGKRDFSCIETESGQTGATFWSLIKYLKMAKPPFFFAEIVLQINSSGQATCEFFPNA
jgi:hypothetical protein